MTKLIPKCQTGKFIGLQWVPDTPLTTSPASTQPYNGVVATIGPDKSRELPVGQRLSREEVNAIVQKAKNDAARHNESFFRIGPGVPVYMTETPDNTIKYADLIKSKAGQSDKMFAEALSLAPIPGLNIGKGVNVVKAFKNAPTGEKVIAATTASGPVLMSMDGDNANIITDLILPAVGVTLGSKIVGKVGSKAKEKVEKMVNSIKTKSAKEFMKDNWHYGTGLLTGGGYYGYKLSENPNDKYSTVEDSPYYEKDEEGNLYVE